MTFSTFVYRENKLQDTLYYENGAPDQRSYNYNNSRKIEIIYYQLIFYTIVLPVTSISYVNVTVSH